MFHILASTTLTIGTLNLTLSPSLRKLTTYSARERSRTAGSNQPLPQSCSAFLRRPQKFAPSSLWFCCLLIRKGQNHKDDGTIFCVLLRKAEHNPGCS